MRAHQVVGALFLAWAVAVASLGCRNEASIEQLTEGQQAFQAHCALCHGDYGDGNGPLAEVLVDDGGVSPARLTDESRIKRLGRNGIRESIKYGGARAGGSRHMPLWGPHLGDQLMDRITDYVALLPEQPAQMRQAVGHYLDTPEGALPRSRALYVHYCSGCHGPYGKGDGPFNPQLRDYLKPVDLTDSTRLSKMDDETLGRTIGLGGAHAAQAGTMSGWINMLQPNEVEALASYLRVISHTGVSH